MKARQQQLLHIEPQQFEVAFMKISAASGSFGSSVPGKRLSEVAVTFPKPTHKLCGNIIFRVSISFFLPWLFFEAYMMFIKEKPLENSNTPLEKRKLYLLNICTPSVQLLPFDI